MGDLSPHFSRWEFACHHCGATKVSPALLDHLEKLRRIVRRPIRIVSGYRCVTHNARVGGARASKHLLGQAADLAVNTATIGEAREAGFTGIGFRRNWAVHVDVRAGPPVVFPD